MVEIIWNQKKNNEEYKEMFTDTTTSNVFGDYEFSYGMGTGKIDEMTLH